MLFYIVNMGHIWLLINCLIMLEYTTLDNLRKHHISWRLLRSDHAPLIASFFDRVFIRPNVRGLNQSDLVEALEDELYGLRQSLGEDAFPKPALDYLNDWAANDKGFLRKYYRQDSDEPQFDLTPASEKALNWLEQLNERQFIGTESRLLSLFDLLKQIQNGSETDPEKRIQELKSERAKLDAEIAELEAGHLSLLDDTAVKERFWQFERGARDLLTDFREVEYNFRQLDRSVRERIARHEGSKGELLGEIMGERDAISDSDQGKSFRAFWEFLLSHQRQQEFSQLLEQIFTLPVVQGLEPDKRLRTVHYDWLNAGEHTQQTVAMLSQQLRRFLDDQAWLENRRIMEILHGIESKALDLRDEKNLPEFMLELPQAEVDLVMERPLFTPKLKPQIKSTVSNASEEGIDSSALFEQVIVDKAKLKKQVQQALHGRSQVSLKEVLQQHPLEQGLAELVAYLQLANDSFKTLVDDEQNDPIQWQITTADGQERVRQTQLSRIIFMQ